MIAGDTRERMTLQAEAIMQPKIHVFIPSTKFRKDPHLPKKVDDEAKRYSSMRNDGWRWTAMKKERKILTIGIESSSAYFFLPSC